MTTDHRKRIEKLQRQAFGLDDGPVKLALLEEAVRLADTLQDVELGFDLREDLTRTATFAGAAEKALVAFAWRLGQSDRDPERFDEHDLLWHYKWVVASLRHFPQIAMARALEMLSDMERRYRRVGLSLRSVWKERSHLALQSGHREAAQAAYRRWQAARADYSSDCTACDVAFQVDYLLFARRPKQALARAARLLAGSLHCAEVPHTTLAAVLLPLVRLGRVEEAMAYHHKGYRLVADNRDFLCQVGQHLTFLVLTENRPAALKLLERHLLWALETAELDNRFEFYLAARFLCEQSAGADTAGLKLRLPPAFPAYRADGRYEAAALASWFDAASRELATRFDARNGNDHFSRRLDLGELSRLVTHQPLRKRLASGEA